MHPTFFYTEGFQRNTQERMSFYPFVPQYENKTKNKEIFWY